MTPPAGPRVNPRRQREFVVEAKIADVAGVEESFAVEVGRRAPLARGVNRLAVTERALVLAAVQGVAGEQPLRELPLHPTRVLLPAQLSLFHSAVSAISNDGLGRPQPGLQVPELVLLVAGGAP